MARVLKITSGLMGVLLLVMVGVMTGERKGKHGVDLMLFSPSIDYTYLYVSTSQSEHYARVISHKTPYIDVIDYTNIHLSPNRHWVYFRASTLDNSGKPVVRLYGVNLLTGETAVIDDDLGFMSIDRGIWAFDDMVIYFRWEKSGQFALYAASYNGRYRQRLTPSTLDPQPGGQVLFMKDEWIYLNVVESGQTVKIFRVRLDGMSSSQLVPDKFAPVLDDVQPIDDWLLVRIDKKIFRMRLDGSSLEPLTSETEAPEPEDFVEDWIPQPQLLILVDARSYDFDLVAIEWQTQRVLWEISNALYLGYTPDQKWVTLLIDGHRIFLASTETSQMIELANITGWKSVLGWSSDGKWFLYLVRYQSTGTELRRISADGNTTESLGTFAYDPLLHERDPDREWQLLGEYSPNQQMSFTLIRSDGSSITQFQKNDGEGFFVDWGPTINRHWQPPTLVATAVMFIFVPPLISRIRLQQKGRI